MVYIEKVHMSGGTGHEHIAEVQWRNPDDGKTGKSSKTTMVDWIDNKNGKAKVTDGRNTVMGWRTSGRNRSATALEPAT